ncbi:MAG: hypothetical protein ALECFALPRED_007013 [Alectoria fallacina]|uniref:F-box domain-containing protein n=1 Tax=Alectoria fallacina TaxID=1903189 RepID=A0A8H3G2M8_9LECA|nr:MAG: hypothetical protein ALECFALPRED_007013 [Alectoria fallacina]
MARYLINIPSELQVSVFGSCEDLDDALHLSQVCRDLRMLFRTDRRRIERQIITSSHVYEYDFCLSKLLTKHEELAELYSKIGKRLPDGNKPSIKVFETCLSSKDDKEGLTKEEIQKIVIRWKHFSFLRGLYVDDDVFKEFDRFRAAFASGLTPEQGATIVSPGFDHASVEASHRHRVPKNRFAGDFKARFHKILCLHSMAIIGLHFAKISTVEPMATKPKPGEPDVAEMIDHLWIKEDATAGGKTTEFDPGTQVDGLEVFDFLYMFLLRKILPYQTLEFWLGNDIGDYPFEWRVAGVPNALELPEWYSFMHQCRQVLQPDDLRGLIQSRAWAAWQNGPPLQSMYMRVRGMFEHGDQNDLGFDWDRDFERCVMVRALSFADEDLSTGVEDPCWWDLLRLRLGSPFLEGSVYKYEDAIDEMQEDRRKEEKIKEERITKHRMMMSEVRMEE